MGALITYFYAVGAMFILRMVQVEGFELTFRETVPNNVIASVTRTPHRFSAFDLPRQRQRKAAMTMIGGETLEAVSQVGSLLLAYSDEPTAATKSVTFMSEVIGVSGVATVGLFGVLASALNLQKTAKIVLTEEEEDAVQVARILYDATAADQELTESGTAGEVKRRSLAMKARDAYQRGKDPREVRDKTLSYAEFDLPYLAKMLRFAQPEEGDVFVDMGSGTGKACAAAGLLYPDMAVCRGVEILDGLHREAQSYSRKYAGLRRAKSPLQFVKADFCDDSVDLSDVDIVFAYATKYATDRGVYLTELSRKLLELKSGARVITVDKRLQGPFNLITSQVIDRQGNPVISAEEARRARTPSTVLDPNGDLQTSTGYLWQRQ